MPPGAGVPDLGPDSLNAPEAAGGDPAAIGANDTTPYVFLGFEGPDAPGFTPHQVGAAGIDGDGDHVAVLAAAPIRRTGRRGQDRGRPHPDRARIDRFGD